ncbi:MAG: hypothetical protein J6Y62_03100 [Clostridia bacterium]|nr:hypothetical protein [Clostridia bacterium]
MSEKKINMVIDTVLPDTRRAQITFVTWDKPYESRAQLEYDRGRNADRSDLIDEIVNIVAEDGETVEIRFLEEADQKDILNECVFEAQARAEENLPETGWEDEFRDMTGDRSPDVVRRMYY